MTFPFRSAQAARLRLGPLGMAVLFACGCGGGSNNTYCPGGASCPPPVQISVSIQPGPANMAAGGSFQFAATVHNSTNQTVNWQVNNIPNGNPQVGTITAAGLYTAPATLTTPAVEKITAIAAADSTQSASVTTSVLAAHRIGVRPGTGSSFAEFYDRSSGTAFVPRGNNYIRIATLIDSQGNPRPLSHSTFAIGLYDANRADLALASMQSKGYNIVTITMEGCCQGTVGDPAGGLNSAYMANIVDFLQRAKTHGIGVVIASQWLPYFGGYIDHYSDCYAQFSDSNLVYLSTCGITATKKYFQDYVQALINAGAPMDAIFAFEIWDEYYYQAAALPLTLTSGSVTTANGQTYDMSSSASRQQMMDDGLVYFTDQVRSLILGLDPTALVTISFFPPEGPNPSRIGDSRIIQVYPAIAKSTLDYVDLHPYPIVLNLTMDQVAQNYGFIGYQQQKPIVMGEYGAFMWAYATASDAAAGMQSWQIQSCSYNFKGWLLWTWDTDEQPELWNALSSGGAINLALAPTSRPDPCSP